MMIAPVLFRKENESASLQECYRIRRELMEDLIAYEDMDPEERKGNTLPSPETIYHMNNLYLKEICELIEEKQNEDTD